LGGAELRQRDKSLRPAGGRLENEGVRYTVIPAYAGALDFFDGFEGMGVGAGSISAAYGEPQPDRSTTRKFSIQMMTPKSYQIRMSRDGNHAKEARLLLRSKVHFPEP
jgi:hypothetical protein